jgi:hypothetical protein
MSVLRFRPLLLFSPSSRLPSPRAAEGHRKLETCRHVSVRQSTSPRSGGNSLPTYYIAEIQVTPSIPYPSRRHGMTLYLGYWPTNVETGTVSISHAHMGLDWERGPLRDSAEEATNGEL